MGSSWSRGLACCGACPGGLPSRRSESQSKDSRGPQLPHAGHQWVVSIVEEDSDGGRDGKHTGPWLPAWRRFAKGVVPVIRARPAICIIPLLVMLVFAAASSTGVLLAARTEERSRRASAQGFAQDTATGFEFKLANSLAPVLALSLYIKDRPSIPAMQEKFDSIASQLLSLGRVNTSSSAAGILLRMAPQGVVTMAHPLTKPGVIGLDLLADPVRRNATLETIKRREVTVQGPIYLPQEGFVGLVMRIPIFIPNVSDPHETFGAKREAYNCSICYDPVTKTKFWGIAGTVVNFEQIAGGSGITNGTVSASAPSPEGGRQGLLWRLERQNYNYALTVPQPGGNPVVIAASPSDLHDPISAVVHSPTNEEWLLQIEPAGGWVPAWRDALLAMVLAISAAIGVMLLCLFVNRQQQQWLMSELRNNNRELTAEKLRTDALLARQYHLINCLMEQGGRLFAADSGRGGGGGGGGGGAGVVVRTDKGGGGGGGGGGGLDTAGTALERIEDVRRAIGTAGAAAASTGALQLLELLGEGGFGKVYKGLWHGTVVAVKTMILPAHMSGAAKRERMAIMEAAISSAMNHPNIVQTYTYTIKPMASTHPAISDISHPSPGTENNSSPGGPESLGGSHILNFEVSLVLEFCELGSLRDALDGGAFVTDLGALNYLAVLDTAADVARAMLHLHNQQVLHSDLKARNVLLKGDSKRGGGAIAKVADFGLALPMRGADTHVSAYQGTPSHMAPEAHVHGRMSKAADVYAFGILLWELYTAGRPFEDTPAGLLGHKVSVEGVRPRFPDAAPEDFKSLAEQCWAPNPGDRPEFTAVLEALVAMRKRARGKTPPLSPYARPQPRPDGVAAIAESSWGEPGDPTAAARPPPAPALRSSQEPPGRYGVTFGGSSFRRRLEGFR